MNILIPDSWLRDYLETDATPKDIQRCVSLCGPSIERLHQIKLPPRLGGRTKEGGIDWAYDVEVTTNRVDCMSVYGFAREAAAILPQFGIKAVLKPLSVSPLKKGSVAGLTIQNDPRLCHRILALKVSGIKVEPSPQWLQDRLTAVGQRPLNNLVDITNYVMWETGHPTHVFDFDRLASGKMLIRVAKKGEKITTLDDKKYVLTGGEVVIDDGTGKIIDLPSIMGTANSVVVEGTKNALLFVDDVKSTRVRFASMKHAIRTQAAMLLEKDINPELSVIAMSRMVDILKVIYPGAKVSELADTYSSPQIPDTISFPLSKIDNLVGAVIPPDKIKANLEYLGFTVRIERDSLKVTPPYWRIADITIPEDVIEEVARLYGYHNIPPVIMSGTLPPPSHDLTFTRENKIKTALKYFGFTEVYSYSLVRNDTGLRLKNPLTSDWAFLRTSLFPSHKLIIEYNTGKAEFLNIFEIANVYLPRNNNLPEEQSRLLLTTNNPDYDKFKGVITSLLSDIHAVNIYPEILSDSGLFYWEIPLGEIFSHLEEKQSYTPISKYSPIIEDVNLNLSGSYSQLEEKLYGLSNLINQIDLIDKYGSKITLRITYHSDKKQLSSEDIAPIREKFTKAL